MKIDKLIKNICSQRAFTLVEAVIAISIIGVIGVIMADILTRAFDNTQKTNLISNVQQNGQAILSSFEDTIRYSEFVCVAGVDGAGANISPNQLAEYQKPVLVVFKDGKYIRIRIIPETTAGINGYVAEDYPVAASVGNTATDLCTTLTLRDNRKITNDKLLSVKKGTITLLTNPVNAPTAGTSKVSLSIKFSIGAPFGAAFTPETQIGQNNEVVFQSTVQFR